MPVNIMLLELLIDPACSIVFESEPAADDIMQRPPHAAGSSPFGLANLGPAVVQGAGFALVLLLGYGWLLAHGSTPAQSRTAVFMALLPGVFLLTLANRNRTATLLSATHAGNRWVPRMLVGVLAMLAAVIGLPFFRHVMQLAVPDLTSLTGLAVMLLATLAWLEVLRRWLGRRRRQAPAPRPAARSSD